MKRIDVSKVAVHALEIAYSLLMLAWTFLPLVLKDQQGIQPLAIPAQLFSPQAGKLPVFILSSICLYGLILISLFKIVSPFLQAPAPALAQPGRTFPAVLSFLCSSFAIALAVLHLLSLASGSRYFRGLSILTYAAVIGSLAYNAYFLAVLMLVLSRTNRTYREYLEFRRSADKREKGWIRLIFKAGIQKKLLLTFVGLTLLIVAVLGAVLMAELSRSILAMVIENGSALTDRTASIVKANFGDEIAINDYLAIEKKKNQSSRFPFNSISFFRRQGTEDRFLVTNSTEERLLKISLREDYRGLKEPMARYYSEAQTYEFLAPVVLSGILIGYVLVDYDRDLIYEPYFRTQVKIILISALFLYLSVYLIYVFGTNIVFPILFLRMGVNRISGTLSGMIHGRLKVSSDLLRYEDKVPTRDEIKSLSNEIGNMTTVIKGIIPYISTSTLKQSERARPTSQAKELTFLFTDIRGFTTLCEGMSPQKVVEMLNHYLDIQSTVILNNQGDIDKFVGDAIMAMFDGSRKEFNACKAAMEIRTSMAREKELQKLVDRDVVSIGIGINTGPVVFGSVGAKDRMDFTSIGDTVNLAARLEGANKTYGTKALITEMVYGKIKGEYLCREIDLLTVKGKRKPVRIYELLQESQKAGEKLVALKRVFETGLELYRQRKWDQALKMFGPLMQKYRDEPSAVFTRRIGLFKANPPPREWDGVFQLTVK